MPYYDGNGNALVEVGGLAPVAAAGTALAAATDTPVPFAQRVRSYLTQNNTAAPVYRALDAAAGPGSLASAPGTVFAEAAAVAVLHLYAPGAATVNGAVAGGIVVEGRV
jgi:hypothetical protein